MRRLSRNVLVSSALALLVCACALGRAPTPSPAPGAEKPAEAAAPRIVSGAELRPALPARADFEERDGRLVWRADEEHAYAIVRARERDWLELDTEIGTLRASWGLLANWNPAPLRDLPRLLALAKEAKLAASDLVFYEEELSGSYLVGPHLYVIREGVLRETGAPGLADNARAAQAADRERVERAVARLVTALGQSGLSPESRTATADILKQIPLQDSQTNLDLAPPSFVRRLVRNHWLALLRASPAATEELERAVAAGETLRAVARYGSEASHFELLEDAYGNRVWELATPERVAYARLEPPPAYYGNGLTTRLVVRLPRGVDPLRAPQRYVSAELWSGSARIAAWQAEGGLETDFSAWRAAFPSSGQGVEWAALPDALPPHILITAPNGDVLALVTRFGVVRPARSAKPADAEAFYREAVQALPDAAHLDLIGQYLLIYAYDSPDPRDPELVGTRAVSGDIHQTAAQTLATTAGGTMRGDCDDLSELDQEIANRQGRSAQLIGLPAHAALAWAAKRDDGSWLTYLLQTGQPLAFAAPTLPESLELAYKSFGGGELFDLTKLEILLRFSGENTRSSWYLSWRIFADPDYARTMIDVQKDWHFQTYQRAIVKMKSRIDHGDQDPANYTELAGLYHYTAQYDLAASALADAIARTEPGETRVSMAIDRVVALASAKRGDEASAAALELREREIPELEKQSGRRALDARLSLADALLVERCDVKLALEILGDDLEPLVDRQLTLLGESLKVEKLDPEQWRAQTEPSRDQLRWYVSSGIALLFATREGELAAAPERASISRLAWRWIRELAFRELDSTESPLARYAVIGRLWEATGDPAQTLAEIEAAPLPSDTLLDAPRSDGPEQRVRDLSFVRISPTFWAAELSALFAREQKTLDPQRVLDLARRAERARDEAKSLGLDHRGFEHELRELRLVTALVDGDERALRAELADIKRENDRRVRMNAASWIAAVARFQSLERFARIVTLWREEVDYKPMWFWIAWSAALNGATDQALFVARAATREFPGDRAFAEEYQFMQRRFAAPPAAGTPRPAAVSRPLSRE
jgi:hypothetical protein